MSEIEWGMIYMKGPHSRWHLILDGQVVCGISGRVNQTTKIDWGIEHYWGAICDACRKKTPETIVAYMMDGGDTTDVRENDEDYDP